jgi:hypothetical protein
VAEAVSEVVAEVGVVAGEGEEVAVVVVEVVVVEAVAAEVSGRSSGSTIARNEQRTAAMAWHENEETDTICGS